MDYYNVTRDTVLTPGFDGGGEDNFGLEKGVRTVKTGAVGGKDGDVAGRAVGRDIDGGVEGEGISAGWTVEGGLDGEGIFLDRRRRTTNTTIPVIINNTTTIPIVTPIIKPQFFDGGGEEGSVFNGGKE